MAVVAAVATVLLIAFLLWFTFGTQRNISRGNELLRWLQAGLPVLGKRTTVRWLGSSAVQLAIDRAEDPYDSAQVNVVLEPRDIGLLWAWARRRGRRDFLILRGTLSGPPRFELEAGAREGWTSTDRLERLDPGAWIRTSWTCGVADPAANTGDTADTDERDGAGTDERDSAGRDSTDQRDSAGRDSTDQRDSAGRDSAGEPDRDSRAVTVDVAHSARAESGDVDAAERVWECLAEATGGRVWRLSVRNLAPNVEVHLEPPASEGLGSTDAAELTEAFAALGRLATRDA